MNSDKKKWDRVINARSKIKLLKVKLIKYETAIYKTRNTGTGNGMRGMPGTQGIFTRIPGNVIILTFRGMSQKLPGNVQRDSGECWRRFRGMFEQIPGDVEEDSGECSRGFRGMLEKIRGNVQEDSREYSRKFRESKFRFIMWNLAYFLSNSAIKMRKNKGILSVLLITTYN